MNNFLQKIWYEEHPLYLLLLPLSLVYTLVTAVRRILFHSGILPTRRVEIPVIIIGNITVGGTGKTPLIVWMAEYLKKSGIRPGIISRGYGGRANKWPQQVRPDSNPSQVGDESVLIAQRTQCPVAVSPVRYEAALELENLGKCDVILCDDGLQHLGLHRDLEIAVVDGDRRFGNGHLLPAGPLRESVSRLETVDLVVANARAGKNEFLMEYIPVSLVSLMDESKELDEEELRGKPLHAVAGIGNPQRFFSYLRGLGSQVIKHEFPDHYEFELNDIQFDDDLPVIMTEKDAVKCRSFAEQNCYYLKIDVQMAKTFEHRLNVFLKEISDGQKIT